MASMNTRLNIEKLDENIVQKHEGSKQVGFKQLSPGVETGVHRVHNEKHVWFEVELQGAQGNCEAEVFRKRNTRLGRRSRREMFLILVIREYSTKSTHLMNWSPSSTIGFKIPIDMLGFFGWLASIKQGMLEPVMVKCIFLGYHKSIVCNELWRLYDVTSKVLHEFEFEVEPLGDHTFEVEPQENVDQGAGLQEVQTQDLMDYHLARDRDQHLACELFGYREDSNEAAFGVAAVEKIYAHESLTFNNTVACEVIFKWKAGLKDDMDARSYLYVLSNGYDMGFSCGCKAKIWATNGLLDKAKGNVLGMKIVRDQSGYTLRVSQSRFYNEKLVHTLLEGHFILSLEGSLSGDCDVKKNGKWSCTYAVGSQEYQMVCMILDMGSADVGYGLMILGCAGSLKANLQHMKALLTTEAGYMTFTEAWKKKIWPKGLLIESRYELRLVAGIATGALVKGGSRSQVPAQVEVDAYRY
nr:zinc finger, CCHC-type [Tanacetum cinerariifolium]